MFFIAIILVTKTAVCTLKFCLTILKITIYSMFLFLIGYMCNTMICWEPRDSQTLLAPPKESFVALTNYFLVALWRTRCNKPRLDAVVFCFFNRRCYCVFNFIPWMNDKFTNPAVLLPESVHAEICMYV